MIIQCIIIGIIAVLCVLPALHYRYYYLNEKRKASNISVILADRRVTCIILLLNFAVGALMIYVSIKNYAAWYVCIEQQLVLNTLIAIAVIDFKVKKIPNQLVALLLAVWILFFAIDVIIDSGFSNIGSRALQALGGLLTGCLVLLICMLVSRGGVGAGDVKLMTILGLFYGMVGALNILFYSCLYAIIISLILIVARKLKLKDSVPMSPFILMATATYNILSI